MFKRPGDYLFDSSIEDGVPTFLKPPELEHLVACDYKHNVAMCKCALPVINLGQDESIYNAYARPKCISRSLQWIPACL
jgi:hypothetical protein